MCVCGPSVKPCDCHPRFVTKSDVTEYISPDNLLVDFGGEDNWKFTFNKEKAQREAEEVWQTDPWVVVNGSARASAVDNPSDTGSLLDPFEDDLEGEEPVGREMAEKEENMEKEEDSQGGRRQVYITHSESRVPLWQPNTCVENYSIRLVLKIYMLPISSRGYS